MTTASKSQVRSRLRSARAGLTDADLARRGESLASALAQHVHPETVVAGYMPMAGEPDIRQFLETHVARTGPVYLPLVPPTGHLLRWQPWNPETQMRQHSTLPISEPDPDSPQGVGALVQRAVEVQLRNPTRQNPGQPTRPAELVMLIPTLALDTAGARLGQGGGYYDATTAQLVSALRRHPEVRCEMIAVVHAAEVLDPGSFPVEAHDLHVSRAATEYRVFDL